MRALVAFVTLTAWSLAHAQHDTHYPVPRSILSVFGIDNQNPVYKIVNCAQSLGFTKCLGALSVWRAQRALNTFSQAHGLSSNLTEDIKLFPWEKYTNTSQELIYSQLCDGTQDLLRYKKLSFTMFPGYRLELDSKGDGKLNVDILKGNEIESRGSMKKKFYNIVPLLLIPGLIMSAILPFVLPAMKLATVGAVMINNMALTGAIFSLLRDNAFNDHYRPKIKYVNAGYKNEEELYHSAHFSKAHSDVEYDGSHIHDLTYDHDVVDSAGEFSPEWLKQYNPGFEYVKTDPYKSK